MPLTVTATVSEDNRHLRDVTTIIFHNGKLFSGADDGIVKVWNADLEKILECQAHQVNVYNLAASGNIVYSCSNDGTIQAWSTDNLEHKNTLLKYDEEVYRLCCDENKLYSGDNKGTIRIFENDVCTQTCNFIEEVSDLIVKGSLVYTVRDRDLVITELSEGKNCMRSMTRKTIEGSCPMAIVGTRLCFASRAGVDILVHDNSKETQFKELGKLEKAHDMIVNALCGDHGNTLYSGGWDKNVKCWDLAKQECIATCHVGCCINALCMGDQGQVYVAGADGFICRLDSK